MDALELTGRARSHVTDVPAPRCTLHLDAVEPFLAMRRAAAREGIDMLALSGFRDFAQQLRIWNEKFRGERPMLDRAGRPVDSASLDPARRVATILLWSALPGASRHHWGTDLDVIDGTATAGGYRVQLVPAEYRRGGPFARLDAWLGRHMHHYGFYRPYRTRGRGVQPEPWHLSYAPVSRPALAGLTEEVLAAAIRGAGVDGEAEILADLAAIRKRYVTSVDSAPRMRSRWARLSRR